MEEAVLKRDEAVRESLESEEWDGDGSHGGCRVVGS